MGIEQAATAQARQDKPINGANETLRAKSCMAIIWVQNGQRKFDKISLIEAVKKMTGVSDACFTREQPAILMVDYSTKETRAVELVAGINALGAHAKIVGC